MKPVVPSVHLQPDEKDKMTTILSEPPAATPDLQRLRNKAKHEIGEKDDLIQKRIAEVREFLEGSFYQEQCS